MKAVIQRVAGASVTIKRKEYSSIRSGILVFLGIEKGDTHADADHILDKTIHLRIFEDAERKMNLSLLDIQGEMLIVSQFTLLADTGRGRRPSFAQAEEPRRARELYEYFIREAEKKLKKVQSGIFQEAMQVALVNDGPVTILLNSKKG